MRRHSARARDCQTPVRVLRLGVERMIPRRPRLGTPHSIALSLHASTARIHTMRASFARVDFAPTPHARARTRRVDEKSRKNRHVSRKRLSLSLAPRAFRDDAWKDDHFDISSSTANEASTSGRIEESEERRAGGWGRNALAGFGSVFGAPRGAATRWDGKPAPLSGLASDRVPNHVAIIMDGNARWATRRRLPRSVGHERGVSALRGVVRCCAAWDVRTLTVFAFSQENFGRNQVEVTELMALVETALQDELPLLVKEGVRVEVIGDLDKVSEGVREAVGRAVEATKHNSTLRLVVALSYGGRQDIVQAAKALANKVASGELRAEDIDEDVLSAHLSTYDARSANEDPLNFSQHPDLLIRTSGEMRLSNFLLWDLAYTELYFANMMWPEFGEAELRRAFHAYAKRDRRFGARARRFVTPR